MRMRLIVLQSEVLEFEVEDRTHRGINPHRGQWPRLACELQLSLFEVVFVEVGIAECVDEVARREAGHLCDHHR